MINRMNCRGGGGNNDGNERRGGGTSEKESSTFFATTRIERQRAVKGKPDATHDDIACIVMCHSIIPSYSE